MAGYSVHRKPNSIVIYKGTSQIILDEDESAKLAHLIWEAQRKYWKKETPNRMS